MERRGEGLNAEYNQIQELNEQCDEQYNSVISNNTDEKASCEFRFLGFKLAEV